MRNVFAALFATALCASPALAQDQKSQPKKEPTEQQKRMGDCSRQASEKTLKGDDRSKFMSTCLKDEQAMTQQERMTACNKEASAKSLKRDDRKKFMSTRLSG